MMELWGGDNSAEEQALLDELEGVIQKIMAYGHEKTVTVKGFVLQCEAESEEYDGELVTSVSKRGQTLGQGRALVDRMEERMQRLEAGEKV